MHSINQMTDTRGKQRVFSPSTIGGFLVMLTIFVILLFSFGRSFLSSYGFHIFTLDAWGPTSSQFLLDPYTTSHIIHGFLFYAFLRFVLPRVPVRFRLLLAVLIEMLWELFENSPFIINRYRQTAAMGYEGDTILNSLSDVFAAATGFIVAYRIPWKATLTIALAFELLMLLIYRDNLTLNILMLLTPIPAVREWQLLHW